MSETNNDPLLETIRSVSQSFDKARIPYALTGSVASGIFGDPLVSADVDFVVKMRPDQAANFVTELDKRFFVDANMLQKAASENGFANILDIASTGSIYANGPVCLISLKT